MSDVHVDTRARGTVYPFHRPLLHTLKHKDPISRENAFHVSYNNNYNHDVLIIVIIFTFPSGFTALSVLRIVPNYILRYNYCINKEYNDSEQYSTFQLFRFGSIGLATLINFQVA